MVYPENMEKMKAMNSLPYDEAHKEIMDIAKEHKIFVIEDCAQSLGAKYKGNFTGSFGDIACFSLIKNLYLSFKAQKYPYSPVHRAFWIA